VLMDVRHTPAAEAAHCGACASKTKADTAALEALAVSAETTCMPPEAEGAIAPVARPEPAETVVTKADGLNEPPAGQAVSANSGPRACETAHAGAPTAAEGAAGARDFAISDDEASNQFWVLLRWIVTHRSPLMAFVGTFGLNNTAALMTVAPMTIVTFMGEGAFPQTILFLVYGIASIAAGIGVRWITRYFGNMPTLVVSCLVASAFIVVMGFAPNAVVFFVFVGVMALSGALANPPNIALFAHFGTPANRSALSDGSIRGGRGKIDNEWGARKALCSHIPYFVRALIM